ncbi:hypothetical protein [Paludifilum halophilum]|nr:hypothetical protein [Paludifilum halophilum]
MIWKLDRLGRSLKHLIEVVNDLSGKRSFTTSSENPNDSI